MLSPRPPSRTAPSIWYAAVAAPHRNPAGKSLTATHDTVAADGEEAAHGRQRAHRSGVAVDLAGGLPGDQGDLPLRPGPAPGERRPPVHRQLGLLLRLGRGERPGDVRRDPRAGRRGPLVPG